jgi:ectoine hydroxylase-related dioxygenase (phytanoyl-CoA dioxygenase family)|tara:strand:- start:2971 stop:3738 length:768 start_codon:yes stop_codon:yes gene_type:complete
MIEDKDKEFYYKNGYLICNVSQDGLIDLVNQDIDKLLSLDDIKTNSKIYSYNDSPRIVESWTKSENCKNLSLSKIVIDLLRDLYDSNPQAFSTINFLHSTEQPLHSDYTHFGTLPEGRLAASWIALEDVSPMAGPLQVVPGSHKLNYFDFEQISATPPKSLSQIKQNYTLYEEWVKRTIKQEKLHSIVLDDLKKGDCVIWHANLLHGSPECQDNSITRKSQVTHWTFEDVERHYNPVFSQRKKEKFVEREVTIID